MKTWLVVEADSLHGRQFAFDTEQVRGLAQIARDKLTPVPSRSDVSLLSHRGIVVPLLDLRTSLGLGTQAEAIGEVVQLLHQREQDHLDWLAALERSVTTGESFTKARDHHKCAFGKWYDGLMSDPNALSAFCLGSEALRNILAKFDLPHQKFHAVADRVLKLGEVGKKQEAIQMMNTTRETTLAELRNLLAQARETLMARQPTMVLMSAEVDGKKEDAGLLVDRIVAVVEHDDSRPWPEGITPETPLSSGFLEFKDGRIVPVLDVIRTFEPMSVKLAA